MKKYELIDTPQNRAQHDLFVKQYNEISNKEHNNPDSIYYLVTNKHMLTVDWITDVEFEEITVKEPELTVVEEVEIEIVENEPVKTKAKRQYKKRKK